MSWNSRKESDQSWTSRYIYITGITGNYTTVLETGVLEFVWMRQNQGTSSHSTYNSIQCSFICKKENHWTEVVLLKVKETAA